MAHDNGTSGGFTISDILWSIYGSSVLSACLNRASQRRSRADLMNLLLLCTTCLETIRRALSWDFVRVNRFEGLALRNVICSTWEKEVEQTLKVHPFHHKHSVNHRNSNADEKRTIQNEWCIYMNKCWTCQQKRFGWLSTQCLGVVICQRRAALRRICQISVKLIVLAGGRWIGHVYKYFL